VKLCCVKVSNNPSKYLFKTFEGCKFGEFLKCSDFRFKYVVTKPIHHSQKILNEAEHTVSLNVKVNKELVSQILSFGSDVTVISPESLRNEIVTKIKTLLGIYFPEQRDDINKIGPCN
jgi:hypothetical protein